MFIDKNGKNLFNNYWTMQKKDLVPGGIEAAPSLQKSRLLTTRSYPQTCWIRTMRKNIFNNFLDDQGIFWGLAAFSFAEIVQITIVEIVFRHTAKKIKARLGSGTSIY